MTSTSLGHLSRAGPLASDKTVQSFFDSLSADEKDLYQATTLAKGLLGEVEDANTKHKENSSSRKAFSALLPFIAGVEQYGTALDVFANSNELLCPIWGGVRVVLHLGKEFGEYFEKLAEMLEEIGNVLGRLPKIVHLYPDNTNLRLSMVEIYQAIFDFCIKAKHVFRVGKSRSSGIGSLRRAVGFATAFRLVWKPFTVQFGGIKDRILKNVKTIDAEADLAERDLAKQERGRDDVRWSKAEQSQQQLADFIDGESIAKVSQWLSPANVSINHKAASSLRHGNTGSWFLEGESFQTWLKNRNSFLWLHAIPGAGKTILASSIINFLRDNVQSKETGLAYFYCDYKDTSKQEPSKVLGTILASLARQNRGVFEEIQAFFARQYQESSVFSAEFDELLHNFESFIGNHFKSVVIVIDALDEANPNSWDCLTHAIKTLQRCSRVKVLVSSRNELPIARAFEHLPRTSIEQSDVASDIMSFITSELTDNISKRKLKLRDPDLERVIRETLVEGSKGMFQWARCQIDSLCKLRNDKAIRSALTDLPRTLQDTYMRILKRVEDDHPDDVETVRRILRWLVRGIRDLTLDELAEAIAIDLDGDEETMDFSAVDNDPEDILELLGGLITVSNRIISLAHFSVKEFLVSDHIKKSKEAFWIPNQVVHSQLAAVCLTYLCYEDFSNPLLPDTEALKERLEEYKFAQYATRAWAVHVHESEVNRHQDEGVVDLTMGLFNSQEGRCKNFQSWAEIIHLCKFHRQLGVRKQEPIQVAAFFGLTEAAQQLLDQDDVSNCELTGPFKASAARGHASIVELFIQHTQRRAEDTSNTEDGAAETRTEEVRCRDLNLDQAAAAKGHVQVIEVLLDHGADINARGKEGTVIQAAALEGRADAVRLLLKRGAAHYVPCKRFGTPLAAAAEKGHQQTCNVLLDAGANPNGRGGYYSCPLVSSIVGKNTNIIHRLIQSGAELNMRGGRLGCPLMAAAAMGMDGLVQELVDLGAQVNDEDDKTSDALYSASLAGHESTVDLLLSLGADVNAKGGKHRHALGAASSEGHLQVVKRLIAAGADVDFFDEHYGNALQTAAQNGHEAVVRILVEAGADPCAEGGDRGSALVCAAASGQDQVITTLYELGVPPGPADNATSALVAAGYAGHESTVALLVARGAHVGYVNYESHTMSYCTVVEAAASKGHLNIVKFLLTLEDNYLVSNDGWYGSALTAAVVVDDPSIEVITALLDAGADPNLVVDSRGYGWGWPLGYAVEHGNAAIVQLLLDRGADVNLEYDTLKSAVQMAAIHEDEKIMDILLEHSGKVNLVAQPQYIESDIEEGLERKSTITAIQMAAWCGHERIVRKLRALGAELSVEVEDAPFKSALQAAAYAGHIEVMKALIELGSDVNEVGGYHGSALQAAIDRGDLDAVKALIDAGANVNKLDAGYWGSPLLAACGSIQGSSQKDIIKLLVERGADVNARAERKILPFPLHMAVFYHLNPDGIGELLLDLGADVNALGGKFGTALQIAAKDGDEETIELLLQRGADPNIQGGIFNTALQAAYTRGFFVILGQLYSHGAVNHLLGGIGGSVIGMGLGTQSSEGLLGCCLTLLHNLVTRRQFDVNLKYGYWGNALQNAIMADREDNPFYYILQAGADVNVIGGRAGTAVTAAAWMGNMEYIEDLLERGADVKLGNHRYPNAAFGATRCSNRDVLKRVLEEGVDVNASGYFGTPLQLAALETNGNLAIMRMLIRAGAEINTPACGLFGTPLQAAAVAGYGTVVRYLLNRGADISVRGGRFGGVLNAAVRHCHVEIVELLLDKGADPNERGTAHGQPLQGAAAGGSHAIVLLLLRRGAEVNATRGKYHTALQAACARGDVQMVKLLVERGADVNKRGGLHGTALQAAAVSGSEDTVQYLLENGATWELVNRKKAFTSYVFDAADELLQQIRDGSQQSSGDEKSSDDGTQEEEEEGEEEDEEEDDGEDESLPWNVESIPNFQDPWKKESSRRWDLFREMSFHSLQQKSLVAASQPVDFPSSDDSPTPGAMMTRTSSLTTGDPGIDSHLSLNRASKSMPITHSEEIADFDISWDVLTTLEVGDI